MKIAIIGNGNVGSALERGLKRAGHDVRATGRENVHETTQWGETILLAVPFGAIDSALQTMGDAVHGKVLIDVTNALDDNMALAVGCTTSGAEELQRKAAGAKVVKRSTRISRSTWTAGRSAISR